MVLAVPEMHLVLLASLQQSQARRCVLAVCWLSLFFFLALLLQVVPCCLHWAQESSSLRILNKTCRKVTEATSCLRAVACVCVCVCVVRVVI